MNKRLAILATVLAVLMILLRASGVVLAAGVPTVTSAAATSVHDAQAVLNGEVTVVNDTNITDRGFVWDTATHGDPGDVAVGASGYAYNWTETGGTWPIGLFNHTVTTLPYGSIIYWRAYAKNDAGFQAYSAERAFYSGPQITSQAATNVTSSTATLNGNLAEMGSYTQVNVYFEYGPTASYGYTTTASILTAEGTFEADISGLNPAVTYHFRAVGTTAYTAGYGSDQSFMGSTTMVAPDLGPTINSAYVYRNCLATGDQLYVVDYNMDYATLPYYTATQAYQARLTDSTGTILQYATLYSMHDRGYGRGVFSFYLDPDTAPTWGSAVTVQLFGNPALTWTGDPPLESSGITYWSVSTTTPMTKTELSKRLLDMGADVGSAWGDELVVGTVDGQRLSADGVTYFTGAIPNIQKMAPNAFPYSEEAAGDLDFDEKPGAIDQATNLLNQLTGGPLDMTALAGVFHISVTWANTLVVFLFMGLIDIMFFGRRMAGQSVSGNTGGNTKGIVLVNDFIFILAAVKGMLPLAVLVGGGLLCMFFTFFVLTYQKSSA